MTADLAEALGRRLSAVTQTRCEVRDLTPLTGGASRQTWSFDLVGDEWIRPLVLRRDPPDAEDPDRMRREQSALVEATRRGVPVPDVVDGSAGRTRGDLDDAGLGGSYLVLTRLPGEALPRRLLGDARYADMRSRLAYDLGVTLAKIHRMDPATLGLDAAVDPLDSLFATYLASGDPLPAIEIAFRWLRRHRPDESPRDVVHGDFRTGNLLVSPERLEGVLDWELVHLGDPMEDLGWLCTRAWRFGSALPVGGFGPREDLFRGYADESGVRPNTDTVRWWEVYGTVHWALICRDQVARADTHAGNALELLAIGRRVAECEYDLLAYLDMHPSKREFGAMVPAPALGTPSADALLGEVDAFIRDTARDADPQTRYRGRVASHVLRVVRRELAAQQHDVDAVQQAVADAGYATEQELALAVRTGNVDAARPAVAHAVRQGVALRVGVANPDY